MKSPFFPRACVFALLLGTIVLCGMGGKPDTPPATGGSVRVPAYVKAATIRDQSVLRNQRPMTITFSEAMVTKELVEANTAPQPEPNATPDPKPGAVVYQALDKKEYPILISPELEGEGKWLTQTTFAFMPTKHFKPGKEYVVMIKENLRSLEGKPVGYIFPFKTESPSIKRINTGTFNAGDKSYYSFTLNISMPILVEALQEHISVVDEANGTPLKVEVLNHTGTEPVDYHIVRVYMEKPVPYIKITVVKDKDADQHPLGLQSEWTATIKIPEANSSGVSQVETNSGTQASSIEFYSPYASESSNGVIYVRFPMSQSLASHDQKDFIEVSPKLEYTLNGDADALVFKDAKPGTEIAVTLLPGLMDYSGRALKERRSQIYTVRDYESAVRFSEAGHVLTPVYGSRVSLDMMNIDKVQITLTRQYDNNLPFMRFNPDEMAEGMMRNIAFKEVILKDTKRNEKTRRAVDIKALANGRHGVFMLNATGFTKHKDSNNEYYSYENSQRRLVILTDIGVTARTFPSGVTVFASSISTAEPLYGAAVNVYSRSNQLLASGRTTPDGLFVYKQKDNWDPQLRPAIVVVQKGEGQESDQTFLPLEDEIYLSDPGTRPYLDSGYEAFLYPPRGVFRPGEKVDIKAFVRDARHVAPSPFPVLFRIESSRGLEIAKGSATLSQEGGANFSFSLPQSAPTGQYTALLTLPGQDGSIIGSCVFSVEDFVPPRLEVSVKPKEDILVTNNELAVELSGQYLFGAPGEGLNYELGYRVAPTGFNPKGWKDYVFGDHERKFAIESNLKYYTGQLDAQGLQNIAFKAPTGWTPPALANVMVVGSVQEDSGRWVTQTGTFTYFPTPYLLGLKLDAEHLEPGKKAKMHVAAVNPDGTSATGGSILFEVYRVQGNWQTVYRNGRYVYNWNEILIPVERLTLESKDGKASAQFTPKQRGKYLVRATSGDGNVVASRRLYAWSGGEYSDDEGTGRMDSVELSFDKKEYLPGETARLSIKAPYVGTLVLGIEKAEQMHTRVLQLKKPATELEIPVTEDMDPNVNVTAWVIRPVMQDNREWFAHRAYGMIGLMVSKVPYTLSVQPEVPVRATPSAPLDIPFTVVDSQGNPVEGEFSVALVDEGILSLTAFKTPNPINFFLERRRSVGQSFDAFDALLRPEAKATPLLIPGGDASADYQGSLSTQQIFLTSYVPTVHTDSKGKGLAHFDIPEYSGKGRLMIVGASHNRFATAEAPVRFAREVVVEMSAPRAVAPGDAFEITAKLFVMDTEGLPKLEGEANLDFTANGPLTLAAHDHTGLPLRAEDGSPLTVTMMIPAKASMQAGIATVTVNVAVPGRKDLSFAKTLEIAVRPPYPRTSLSTFALIKAGDDEDLEVPGGWMEDTLKVSLSVDKSPVMAVLPMLEYLREYPYGCLEQTVSRAWPYLTLQSVQEALYPEKDQGNNTKAILASTVARVSSMQTASGGFGLWPGYSSPSHWRSVNAIFFLVEARSRVNVSPAVMEASLAYLRGLMSMPPESFGSVEHGYTTKAFAAFVLTRAGEAPLGWIQHIEEQKKHLYPSGQMFLAGAKALKAGNSKALKDLKIEPLSTYKLGYNGSLESSMRNQSLLLYMWSLVDPSADKTNKLCLELAKKIAASRWYSVQEAGMASMALGTYLEKTGGAERGKYTADITANGIGAISLKNGEPLVTPLALKPQADGTLPKVHVKVGGKGQAYCIMNVRGTSLDAPKPASDGLRITRTWETPEGGKINLGSGRVTLKKGDRIIVKLKVATDRPVADIALSDLLPGGLEIENSRLSTSTTGAQQGETVDREAEQGGMFVDMREDRMLVFFDSLYREQTFNYSMRAVSKGTFVIPPLAADAMYDPAFSAIGESAVLVVE